MLTLKTIYMVTVIFIKQNVVPVHIYFIMTVQKCRVSSEEIFYK